MPSVSEKQRKAMAIAEHEPDKLYKKNRGMLKMSHEQLHDFALNVDTKLKNNKSSKSHTIMGGR
jgi:hypothetical protein